MLTLSSTNRVVWLLFILSYGLISNIHICHRQNDLRTSRQRPSSQFVSVQHQIDGALKLSVAKKKKKRTLSYKHIYIIPIFVLPMIASAGQITVVIMLDAAVPSDDMHCGKSLRFSAFL